MNEINIKSNDKILIVAPHPDDECIGTGGILCKYHKQCTVIVLTDGALGNNSNCLSRDSMPSFLFNIKKFSISNCLISFLNSCCLTLLHSDKQLLLFPNAQS